MASEEQLMAITPLDGRYAENMEELTPIVSECGLIKYRALVEIEWLKMLCGGTLPDITPMDDLALHKLDSIAESFGIDDALRVKEIEKTTRHDVKSVELWLRERLGDGEYWGTHKEMVHFGATSEDITNLAIAMMLRDAKDDILLPNLDDILENLTAKAHDWADIAMLSHTHGQAATPTTLGKEMAVFGARLTRSMVVLDEAEIMGKFNGATGNHNALTFTYPEVDWIEVEKSFVQNLGFEVSGLTTQIEPHDWQARFFYELAMSNTILLDLVRDIWAYISMDYMKQALVDGEVGSSTMPHKVNPIDFENAEGNLGTANALLVHMAVTLPTSRLQRDLSDSTTQRSIGPAFGHTLQAYQSLKRGLGKISPNVDEIKKELYDEWSILTEAVQTMMRRYEIEGAYEAIKKASRGRRLSRDDYLELIDETDLPEVAKKQLRRLTPAKYIGTAATQAARI